MPKILLQIALVLLLGQCVAPAKAKIMISVDIDRQRMKVTNNNGRTFWWAVSSGRDGFETPTGSFGVQRLDANHFSDEYEQAPMPYAIFFHEGFAGFRPKMDRRGQSPECVDTGVYRFLV